LHHTIGTTATTAAAGDHTHSTYLPLTGGTLTGPVRDASDGLTDGANIAVDMDTGPDFTVTLGGNRTFDNPTNIAAGQSGVFEITQDGTGSRTAAWDSYYKFPGGAAPTLSLTAGAVDVIPYWVKSATVIRMGEAIKGSA